MKNLQTIRYRFPVSSFAVPEPSLSNPLYKKTHTKYCYFFYFSCLAPHSAQNFATLGLTALHILYDWVSTPAGGLLLHSGHRFAAKDIVDPQCIQ